MVGSGTSTTSRQCRLEGYVLKHIARQRRQRRGCRGEWCTQEHRADCHSPPPDAWHRRTASLISPERDKSGDRPLDALSDLEVALLGLLSVRPMTGYEIKRQYARGIAPWWETPRTQIYPKLRELERRGLVRHQYIVQQGKPNKRVYSLQPHGSAALEDWLRTDIRWPDLRQHMMMRLFLGNLLPTDVMRSLLQNYRERTIARVTTLREARARFAASLEGPYRESVFFELLSLDHLLAMHELEVSGSTKVLEALEQVPRVLAGSNGDQATQLLDIMLDGSQ